MKHLSRGFSMVESVAAVAVVSVLAVAVLSGIGAIARHRQRHAERARATLLAQMLLDEMLAAPYTDPGAASGTHRERFDDFDDYHGLDESPPLSRSGAVIPDASGFRWTVSVAFVRVDDPSLVSVADTGLRRATVTVRRGAVPLASLVAVRSRAWDAAAIAPPGSDPAAVGRPTVVSFGGTP